MARICASLAMATAVTSALRMRGKPLIDAISIMRAEMCAHQANDADTYPDCLKFMTTHCNPGPDGRIDGSPGEKTTGEGFCAAFFNRDAGAGAAGAPSAAPASAPGAAAHTGASIHDVVAFDVVDAGCPAVMGAYVVHGTHDGFTRYVQAGGNHEMIHVNGFWLVHELKSHGVSYAVQSDKRTPPAMGWEGGPGSGCIAGAMPKFEYREGAGRPTTGDVVEVVRCKIEEHCGYVGKSGLITHDFHDEQPFQIASLGGEYFYENEVVMGQRRACQTFDGTWLNEMDGQERNETIAHDIMDGSDFRVSTDCQTCYMSHNGYKLTGQISAGGLYIVWNNGFSWTKHHDGEVYRHVANLTSADLVLQGPLPHGFEELFAEAVSAAVRGVRREDVKVTKRTRLEDGKMAVRFLAPAERMMEIHRQTADMHSTLASGVLRKFLVDRRKYHHINTQNAEFSTPH